MGTRLSPCLGFLLLPRSLPTTSLSLTGYLLLVSRCFIFWTRITTSVTKYLITHTSTPESRDPPKTSPISPPATMASRYLLASLLPALALAQSTTTVSLWVAGADQQSLVASVVAVDATATTYMVTCPSSVSSDDCGFPSPVALTEGANFYAATLTVTEDDASVAVAERCTKTGSSAVCTDIYTAVGSASAGTVTALTTLTSTSISTLDPSEITSMPVVVTAGAEKLNAVSSGASSAASSATAASAASSGSASARSSGASMTTATATGSSASASASGSASGSATGSAAAATHTGAASNVVVSASGLGLAGLLLSIFVL